MAEGGCQYEGSGPPQLENIDAAVSADETGETFDDVKMALTGINMLLNDGFEEAFALFHKYKDESPLMHSGFSLVYFMQALMSFEEEKLGEALKVLQETEKKCSTNDGFVKSFKKRFSKKKKMPEEEPSMEERIQQQVIVADCLLYQAILVFTGQDIPSYVKGGWLLRKAWKIYDKLHRELSQLGEILAQTYGPEFSSPIDPSSTQKGVPAETGAAVLESTSNEKQVNGAAHAPIEAVESTNEKLEPDMSPEVLGRLMGAVKFGYGTFQLSISMVPPRILKLIEFLGFEGDRGVGLTCLAYTSHSRDMKAPLATLALLWYHTVLRPFFALDGANQAQAGSREAELIIKEKEGEFPNSSLFLFFQGRIRRLEKKNAEALSLYQRALEEAKGQREIELMCLYEISWCHSLALDWKNSRDGFTRLQKESKWSRAYYTYLVAVCTGSLGEVEAAHDMFRKVPSLIKRKNNQIEAFVNKRAEKFKKVKPTQEHCRLLTLEMIFLWHAIPTCTEEELRPFLAVCDSQTDHHLLPLKCLLEGSIYKELGEDEMALTCLQEALARHQGKKDEMYIPAFTLFEMASILMKDEQTIPEAQAHLQLIKDSYKDYDFENRLSVRVNNALKRLKASARSTPTHTGKNS